MNIFINEIVFQKAIRAIRFILDITGNESSYYCATQNQRDSVMYVEYQRDENATGVNDKMKMFERGGSYLIQKTLNKSRYEYYESMLMSTSVSKGRLAMPKWQISNETKTIDGYLCHKAVAEYLGRRWTAWFTEEIPIPDGPWFLHGLPGLVLEAFDSNRYFVMEFRGIQKFDIPMKTTIYVAIAITERTIELGLKQMERVLTLYYEDFDAHMAFDNPDSEEEMEFVSSDGSLPPAKVDPYIPIINL